MTITFTPAVRQDTHVYIAIGGTPGSGKTLSALLLARGLTRLGGNKIALIETEGQRSLDLHACAP
ncbi:MAG: AAA family ATPase, partial [Geminicoccaceae bacterium]